MYKLIILATSMVFTADIYAEASASWGYSGDVAPERWASLTVDNFACTGKNQSPINLTGFIEATLDPVEIDYQQGGYEVVNNGHTIQINVKEGSSIKFEGQTFNLLQVHFHAPSENHINGQSYPLEAHFVHADLQGNLAVIGVMYEQGSPAKKLEVETDKWLKNIWSVMPLNAGKKQALPETVNVADILPEKRDYYRFNGSLTTPPCSEGVRWLVMKESIKVDKQQIDNFSNVLHEPNNRPLQAVNARIILE